MALLSIMEIIDIFIITAAMGYIFSGIFSAFSKKTIEGYEPLAHVRGFDWHAFKFAAIVTAPAIILHEFGHKFVALLFGATATFHAAYAWLALGVVLKLLNTGFIFFVPAYVSHSPVTQLQGSMIAFAGPFVNLALWLLSILLLKTMRMKRKYLPIVFLTGRINMFLFLFNMIPIPGFDGYWVLEGLLKTFL